jgi:prophage antirepressor-like protein
MLIQYIIQNSMNFQIINNNSLNCELQYIEANDEIWFRAKNVALVLGFTKSNTNKAILQHVDDEDKCKFSAIWGGSTAELPSNLNKNDLKSTMINESGLYSLIINSKLPTAKLFKRWVTSVVLPSIRKTGSYAIPQTDVKSDVDKQLENTTLNLMMMLMKDDDCKLQTVARDYIHNKFSLKQIAHEGSSQEYARDITDLCKEEFGFVPNNRQKIQIGQLLKKEYTKEFAEPLLKYEKYVNGSMRKVNAYPKNREQWILDTLTNYDY